MGFIVNKFELRSWGCCGPQVNKFEQVWGARSRAGGGTIWIGVPSAHFLTSPGGNNCD